MFAHHAETIERVKQHFAQQPEVRGLILAGSIAHNLASEFSDVDILIVVSDEEHNRRLQEAETCFFSKDLCTYEAGYVDGKYISHKFLLKVLETGSEPARFAVQDAQVLFSDDPELPALLAKIARYPVESKQERILQFQTQVQAWSWFTSEALKRQDEYLLRTASTKLALFAGRIVLAHNELLYPFHKWFMTILSTAPDKPEGFVEAVQQVLGQPSADNVERLGELVRQVCPWRVDPIGWGAQFMQDTELSWMHGGAPVDDL